MIDIALNPETGDLVFENFDLALVDNVNQIAQNLAIRLRFIQGEWYLNVFAGIPYYKYFFIKNPNQIQVETFLKDEISGTTGVTQITAFSSDYNGFTRKFFSNFSCIALNETLDMELALP
jgi:hypothetical protein